jgi:hypothetical protein
VASETRRVQKVPASSCAGHADNEDCAWGCPQDVGSPSLPEAVSRRQYGVVRAGAAVTLRTSSSLITACHNPCRSGSTLPPAILQMLDDIPSSFVFLLPSRPQESISLARRSSNP